LDNKQMKKSLPPLLRLELNKAFTLFELLIVIAIIGIMATVLVTVMNPAQQLAKARDIRRETDLISILTAVYQYTAEHSGELPDTDGDSETSNFPTSATCIGTDLGCFDLANAGETGDEMVPIYMAALPKDPKTGVVPGNHSYTIYVDANGRLYGAAPNAETRTVSVTK
jgi:prepilin-type N-terminal cleavage/methylation domain-containing protein